MARTISPWAASATWTTRICPLYSVHINDPSDWTQGATFTGDNNSQLIPIATFTPACDGGYGGACVPQKGISDLVDSVGGGRLMYRFAYWEDQPQANVLATPPKPAPAQHWLVNFDVQASGGNIGPRWIEFTAPIKAVQLPPSTSSSREPMLPTETGAGWAPSLATRWVTSCWVTANPAEAPAPAVPTAEFIRRYTLPDARSTILWASAIWKLRYK